VSEYRVPVPPEVTKISNFFSIFNVSLFSFVQLSCRAEGVDEFGRLIIMSAVPALLMAIFFLLSWVMTLKVWRFILQAPLHRREYSRADI
jgi:hypothetical protein